MEDNDADDDSSQDDGQEARRHQYQHHQHQSPQPSPALSSATSRTSRSSRTSRASRPVDIDIRSISSHAQAEALVQQAQQRIFDFVNNPSAEDINEGSSVATTNTIGTVASAAGEGRTPLSARLAAYGQSLKIEQKFKEEEEKRRSPRVIKTSGGSSQSGRGVEVVVTERSVSNHGGARGLDRTFSLEERHHVPGSRSGRVRRPHTAGGTRKSFLLFCLKSSLISINEKITTLMSRRRSYSHLRHAWDHHFAFTRPLAVAPTCTSPHPCAPSLSSSTSSAFGVKRRSSQYVRALSQGFFAYWEPWEWDVHPYGDDVHHASVGVAYPERASDEIEFEI